MSRNIFLVSATLSLLFTGLSQIPDAGILGIDEEPERILFYGGSGLLAGLFGLVSLGSGTYLCMIRLRGYTQRPATPHLGYNGIGFGCSDTHFGDPIQSILIRRFLIVKM